MPPSPPPRDDANGPFDLSEVPIHLGLQDGTESLAVPLHGFTFDGPSFEKYIAEHCPEGGCGRLIMIETTPTSWPVWECHTEGDEIVIVLEGAGEFIHETDGGERRTAVAAGSTMINPKGVWHTADVTSALKGVYITPIPGTEHRPR